MSAKKNVYHAKNFTSAIFYDKRKMHCQEKKQRNGGTRLRQRIQLGIDECRGENS